MQLVLLEAWWIAGDVQLRGRAYGHSRFANGEVITSSKITSTPMTEEGLKPTWKLTTGDVVTTMNTTYILGMHHAELYALSHKGELSENFQL